MYFSLLTYAFTGALATSFYGIPRTTSDIDVLVGVADEKSLKMKLLKAHQSYSEIYKS
jgi:predicted nucleotidyltransferase